MNRNVQKHPCRFCPESYSEVLGFLDHFETHMNQNEQNKTKHQSSIHQEDEDQIQNEEAKSPKSINQMTNTSQISEKDPDFLKNSSLNKRLSSECKKCGKTFSMKCNLEKHIKTVHDKVKSYKCDLCMKAFGQKGDLQRHIQIVHHKVNPHK